MSKSVWGAQGKIGSIHVGVDGVARKVTKGYVGVQGVARLFYESESKIGITYTGTYETSDLTVGGVKCTLYKLTKSGKLTVTGDSVRTWMCGGGGNGRSASQDDSYPANPMYFYAGGAGGGGGDAAEGELIPGTYTVTIGAAEAATTIKGPVTIGTGRVNSSTGGSGGGSPGTIYVYNTGNTQMLNNWNGKANGSNVIPFGTIQDGYCAGGGGGCATGYAVYGESDSTNTLTRAGSSGGSRGASGSTDVQSAGGSGGTKGGGAGGGWSSSGSAATFYGSGGGGGTVNLKTLYGGGSGYQGIAMLIVPKDKEAR